MFTTAEDLDCGLPKYRLRYRLQLHVGSAFVDSPDLCVAEELLRWIVGRVAVTAEQLDAQRRNAPANLRRIQFCHRAFARDVLPRILEPGRVVDHEPSRFDFSRCLGNLKLDGLHLRQRLAELLALLDVSDRSIECALCDPDHLCAD